MPLFFAFLISATLHAATMLGPWLDFSGWRDAAAETESRLDARLAPPLVPAAEPPSAPLPPPRRVAARSAPRPANPPTASSPASDADSSASAVTADGAAEPAAAEAITASPAPTFFDPARVLAAQGRVRYLVSRGEGGFVVGQAVHTWQREGTHYQLESVTETTGLAAVFKPARIVQQSRGEVTATGLQPQFVHQEDKKGVSEASLDWAARRVAVNGRSEVLPEGTQDMLSMYYQLAWPLAAGEQALEPVELPILTRKAIEIYRFEPLGREVLNYQQRELTTWRYRVRNGSDTIELWFAPELAGLPVLIRFIDRKGELFEQRAEAIELTTVLPSHPVQSTP